MEVHMVFLLDPVAASMTTILRPRESALDSAPLEGRKYRTDKDFRIARIGKLT